MTRGSWWMLVLTLTQVMTGCTPPQSQETDLQAREKGGEDVTGPYDVVEDWLKPLPWHQGWTFGLVAGVFAESADRIYVDDEGNLYVADYANFRVQKFTPKVNADPSRLIGPRYVSGTPTSQG